MPSHIPDTGWDFGSVYDLLDQGGLQEVSSPLIRPSPQTLAQQSGKGGVSLGNFSKLFQDLGLAEHSSALPLPPLDADSELSTSDEALLPSPVLTSVPPSRETILKDLTFETPAPTIKTQSRSNLSTKLRAASPTKRPSSPTKRPASPIKRKSQSSATINQGPQTPVATKTTLKKHAIVQPSTPQQAPRATTLQHAQTATPVPAQAQSVPSEQITLIQLPLQQDHAGGRSSLIPRTVQPVRVKRPESTILATPSATLQTPSRQALQTQPWVEANHVTLRSQNERHIHLLNEVIRRFPEDVKWIVSPRQMLNEKATNEGIHVFVDASNIMWGFRDMLRNHGLHEHYHMSFDSLALLLERRRPVAKRVFAGSHREARPLPQVTRLVEASKAVGYENFVKEQVYITREETEKKKFFNYVKKVGYKKAQQMYSGSGSDSETNAAAVPKTPSAPKWVEQGVDEILHLKMCHSIMDYETPSTIVLATGDGAEAEMSDGFLAHVERALKRGWNVELVSWKQQTNRGYLNKDFQKKWADQFRVIELDDFLEDLVDTS